MQAAEMKLRTFGGGRNEPVQVEEIAMLIELDNEIARKRRRRDTLAANLLRRVEAQGGEQIVGPHWLTLRRRSEDENREVELMVDGFCRLRLVDRVEV